MELLVETIVLRPYVFLVLASFLAASIVDLGGRRTLLFGAVASSVAWLAEFSSTRIGLPFGLYHYTGTTRGQEIFIAGVPAMDPLSFAFLTYGAFCVARSVLAVRTSSRATLAIVSGSLMMLLDVVIDPLAVRGDRWFLGRTFTTRTAAPTSESRCRTSGVGCSWVRPPSPRTWRSRAIRISIDGLRVRAWRCTTPCSRSISR